MNRYGVKLTVVRTEFYPELAADLDMNIEDNKSFGSCPVFKVGQEILITGVDDIPKEFDCPWAWADIERDIALILYGGQPQPVLKNPNSMYSCCDEGLRPVIFKLERVILE